MHYQREDLKESDSPSPEWIHAELAAMKEKKQRKKGRDALATLLQAGILTALGTAAVAGFTVHKIRRRKARGLRDQFFITPHEMQVSHESVEFVAEDGIHIKGWWMPQNGDRVIIGCSGFGGKKDDLIGIATALYRAGYSLLLFDFRGQGESQNGRPSLGLQETRDMKAAIGFVLAKQPQARIGLLGYSMGGSVAISVAAADPSIKAVVSDSAFAETAEAIRNVYRKYYLPSGLILPVTDFLSKILHGYSILKFRPVEYIAHLAPRPVLLIHGSDDKTIPVINAHLLYDAAGEGKEIWIDQGIDHCGAYFADRQAYTDRVINFFDRSLQ